MQTLQVKPSEVRTGDKLQTGQDWFQLVIHAWSTDDGTGYVQLRNQFYTMVLPSGGIVTVQR